MSEENKPAIGDLFRTSWGYDQTNVDFYQVVRLTGKCFFIREIASKAVPGTSGFMSCKVTADPGNFKNPSPEIRVRNTGVKGFGLNGHYAAPTTSTAEHYNSWYA